MSYNPSHPRSFTLDQYDNALIQYLKRTNKPKLSGIVSIWAWRCCIEEQYVYRDLPAIAHHLYEVCEECDLLGASSSSSPIGFGGFGLMVDAAPSRAWMLSLDAGNTDGPLTDPDRAYWWRILSVLCSRLTMSEVSKLPGYNHEAKVGPMWDEAGVGQFE